MHRSGTSLLTGSLQDAGLALHRVHESNPHNKKGNRENQAIVELNNWVLDSNGGSWDQPPETLSWSTGQMAQGRQILDQYSSYRYWGFKDPRLLLTLDGWRTLIPHLEFVGIFRHPLAVARSLNTRNEKTSIGQGIDLWLHYNQRLLALYKESSFPVLCFEDLQQGQGPTLQRLAAALGLPRPEKIGFYDARLINQEAAGEESIPQAATELYEKLRSVALP